MATIYTHKNGTKSEAVKNTLVYDNVEVPDAALAKRVWIVSSMIQLSMPDYVAASSTKSAGLICCGKVAPTTAYLAEEGAIHEKGRGIHSTGAAGFAATESGLTQQLGRFEIFKSPDGKFYFTPVVQGVNNSAALTRMDYRVDFEVET